MGLQDRHVYVAPNGRMYSAHPEGRFSWLWVLESYPVPPDDGDEVQSFLSVESNGTILCRSLGVSRTEALERVLDLEGRFDPGALFPEESKKPTGWTQGDLRATGIVVPPPDDDEDEDDEDEEEDEEDDE
jgi:hypothetical protein